MNEGQKKFYDVETVEDQNRHERITEQWKTVYAAAHGAEQKQTPAEETQDTAFDVQMNAQLIANDASWLQVALIDERDPIKIARILEVLKATDDQLRATRLFLNHHVQQSTSLENIR